MLQLLTRLYYTSCCSIIRPFSFRTKSPYQRLDIPLQENFKPSSAMRSLLQKHSYS